MEESFVKGKEGSGSPKTVGWVTPQARLGRYRSGSVEATLDFLAPLIDGGTEGGAALHKRPGELI